MDSCFNASSSLHLVPAEFKLIQPAPDNVFDQLKLAVGAVYNNWFSDKAVRFRREMMELEPGKEVIYLLCFLYNDLELFIILCAETNLYNS